MNLKHALAIAALSSLAVPSIAADQSIDLSSGAASFVGTGPLLDQGDDVITFINLPVGPYNFLLSISAQYIPDLAGNVNTQSILTSVLGPIAFGYSVGTDIAPFVLTLTGTPGGQALYSGDFSVTAVPEPGSYALLLAGLGIAAAAVRRRRAA